MQLTKKQVEDVAKLARLELTDKDKNKFQKDLSAVLDFIDKLNKVKTDKIQPMAHITGLENISREDEAIEIDKELRNDLLNLAPEVQDGYIKVKSIL